MMKRISLILCLLSYLCSLNAVAVGEETKERTRLQQALPEYIVKAVDYSKGLGLGQRKYVFQLPKYKTDACGQKEGPALAKSIADAQKLEEQFAATNKAIDFAYFEKVYPAKQGSGVQKRIAQLEDRKNLLNSMLVQLGAVEVSHFEYMSSCHEAMRSSDIEKEVANDPLAKSVKGYLNQLSADLQNLKDYIEFERNPLAVIEGADKMQPLSNDKPVLKQLIDQEASAKRVHIASDVRAMLSGGKAGALAVKEKGALDAITSTTAKIRSAKDALDKNKKLLESMDANKKVSAEFKSAQDAYDKAFSYFAKYFKAKYKLEEDERESEISYTEDKISRIRVVGSAEKKDLEQWLSILKDFQNSESRATKIHGESFGVHVETTDERTEAEKGLWSELYEKDSWFISKWQELVANGLVFDYTKVSGPEAKPWVKDPSAFGMLRNYGKIINNLKGLVEARLTKKASGLELNGDDLREVREVQKLGYKEYQAKLIVNIKKNPKDASDFDIDDLNGLEKDGAAIEALVNSIENLRTPAKDFSQAGQARADLTQKIETGEQSLLELEKALSADRANRNLYAYQSLATGMYELNAQIRNAMQGGGDIERVKPLRMAFVCLMHRLEILEFQLAKEYKGQDPYPRSSVMSTVRDVIKGAAAKVVSAMDTAGLSSYMQSHFSINDNQSRPSKEQLTLDYQWALHGSTWSGAFFNRLKSFANAAWQGEYREFLDYFSYKNLNELLKQGSDKVSDLKQFANQNPILASDLARNLTQTYLILAQLKDEGAILNAIRDVRTIYQMKEMENIARDWLLGTEMHLYSDQNFGAPISENALLVIGAAEMAPYIAGALVGAMGGGSFATWSQSFVEWLPVIGTWKPLKVIAGAAGGVAQVQAQKYAASKMSHEHEVLANTIRRGFEAAYAGKTPTEIAKVMVAYRTGRFVIQGLGTISKVGLKEALKRAGQCVARNPDAVAGGSAVAVVGGAAAGCALFTASAVAAPIVVPILVAGGVFGGAIATIDAVKDWWMPERRIGREFARWEEKLKQIELPSAGVEGLSEEDSAYIRETFPQIRKSIDLTKVRKEAEAEAQKTQKPVKEILQRRIVEEIENGLENADLAQAEKLQGLVDKEREKAVPDPDLKNLKEKLDEIHGQWGKDAVRGLLNAADAAANKLETDSLTDSIKGRLKDVRAKLFPEAGQTVDVAGAKRTFDFARREAGVLRTRQVEAGLADTYKPVR